MRIDKLAAEYDEAAEAIQVRLAELERELKMTRSREARKGLEQRMRPLRVMYGQTRQIARHLEGYYARRGGSREDV